MLNKKVLGSVSAAPAEYIEDVFSTFMYKGTGSAQTINNGIDLSGKGGLTWLKTRSGTSTGEHYLIDTVRGNNKLLSSSSTAAEDTDGTLITAFNNNGFSLGTNGAVNTNGREYCSWTFREKPKFFDVVTYTGNGSTSTRDIAHNLGSNPGMIIVKQISATGNWKVFHRSGGSILLLNEIEEANTSTTLSGGYPAGNGSSVFSLVPYSSDSSAVNANGVTYVAYLFAHNAGGFGTAGTDNVISCGSFTTDSSGGYSVNLGYEAQYVLLKRTNGSGNWFILDVVRGAGVASSTSRVLKADLVAAETTESNLMSPLATGFGVDTSLSNLSSGTYVYMAIRRPMKVPTSGTQVFKPVARTGTDSSVTIDAGFTVDLNIASSRDKAIQSYTPVIDRLRGGGVNYRYLNTQLTDAETTGTASGAYELTQNGVYTYNTAFNSSSETYVHWMFKRATGFFDIVCYTGNGSNRTITHNLGVAPELMIVKRRDTAANWICYNSPKGATEYLLLNSNQESFVGTFWNDTTPTSTVFSLGTGTPVNASGGTFVAYLFATLAGVSKVGSYTGNGSSQTINCGFTGGARFVLIKRTDSNGDWYVFDTARGIVSGNDPFLLLNSTAAEVTTRDAIDPDNSGFIVNNDATNFPINVNNATYIFLAIA